MVLNDMDERRQRWRFVAIATLIVILALSVRAVYVFSGRGRQPFRRKVL